MIESIIITDLSEAISYTYKETKYNAWLTTVGFEDMNDVNKLKRRHYDKGNPFFFRYFADWSDEDSDVYSRLEAAAPQQEDVDYIIDYLRTLVNSEKHYFLGINCFAGISRSTACGIIAWVLQGKTVEEALEEILKVRPMAHPNLRILRLASKTLGVDLFTPVKEWKESIKGIIFSNEGKMLNKLSRDDEDEIQTIWETIRHKR